MPYVNVKGNNIYYEAAGAGFPIVLLHPWPTDHAMWMLQVPIFSADYRVITPDSIGLGQSDKPRSGITLKGLADDVNALLDELGEKKAFIVGLSLGGAVAQRFCIDHPEKVQASIWVGAPKLPTDGFMFKDKDNRERPLPEVYLEALESKGYLHFWETVWKANIGYMFHKDFVGTALGSYITRYLFEDRYARFNRDPSGVIAVLNSLRKELILDEFKKIAVPVSMIAGDGDPTLPYCLEQHSYLPNAEFTVISNSGHMCIIDQAEDFNKIMSAFMHKHTPIRQK